MTVCTGKSHIAAVCLTVAFSATTTAAPWVSPGDMRMRHSLQHLSDQRVLHTPLTTWPIMWVDVQDLDPVGTFEDQDAVAQNLAYLKFESSEQARSGFRSQIELNAASDAMSFRGFSGQPRERGEIGKHTEWAGDWAAIGVSPSYAFDPQDDRKYRLDGSYGAITLGNWVLGVGAIERWWGPGWQTSLLLSTNARPVPGAWFNRKQAFAPESRWLSWIGPWTFIAFGGQLESNRHIPEAKLLGARFTFMPVQGLEIGLTRTAQWGGEGRPESLSNLFDLMLGTEDNVYTEEAKENEPGNQLGSIDFRYGFAIGQGSLGIYGQMAGEDEAGGLPSKRFLLAGLDASTAFAGSQQRYYLEYTDTVVGSPLEDAEYNVAYEHHLYRTGYRYRGRNIGATWESDARAYTFGFFNFFSGGQDLGVNLSWVSLNRDGKVRSQVPSADDVHYQIADSAQKVVVADAFFRFVMLGGRTTFWGQWMDKEVSTVSGDLPGFAAGVSWEYRL